MNNGEIYDDDFDDFEEYVPQKQVEIKIEENDDIQTKNLKKKLNHKTDTSSFNEMDYEIISPEEATAQSSSIFNGSKDNVSNDYADPILARAVYQIENKLNRKINYDEFDKLCKTYAAELANRDAEYRNDGQPPNQIDFKLYYDTLIQNKKVQPAYKMHMQNYESSLVDEIGDLLDRHQVFDDRDIHVERGSPINIRHKGKVYIRDEEKNREIIINNKKDVELLHMKHRQEWLDKKYKEDIAKEINGEGDSHSSDGFE